MNKFYETLTVLVILTLIASGAIAMFGPHGKNGAMGFVLAQLPLYSFLAWSGLVKLARR